MGTTRSLKRPEHGSVNCRSRQTTHAEPNFAIAVYLRRVFETNYFMYIDTSNCLANSFNFVCVCVHLLSRLL